MIDAYIIVRGFVQGVGYRKFIRKQARTGGFTGWVRNLPDGSVEALIQGRREDIESLIQLCQQGPLLAAVESIDTIWEDQKEKYSDFSIRHDF